MQNRQERDWETTYYTERPWRKGHSKQNKCTCTCVLFRTVSDIELFHCTDEQQAMSSHELQSALMLTVEYSKMYCNG
jgi:hypothetical protein